MNAEHLRAIEGTVRDWNDWRQAKNVRHPDLVGANLSGRDLSGANFQDADLRDADLTLSRFSRFDVGAYGVHIASFRGANLKGARLFRTTLVAVDFRDADLSNVDLTDADLRNANLSGCNMRGAIVNATIFASVDLSEVAGLDELNHHGPSNIGIDAVYRSRAHVPEAFLRSSGVPDSMIDFIRSLRANPNDFFSCFVAHSQRDKDFVAKLAARLRDHGLNVFCAPHDMKGGEKALEQISQQVQAHDKFLLVLSDASMQSGWVDTEIRIARRHERKLKGCKLFPIRLVPMERIREWTSFDSDSGEDLAREIRNYHIPDFSQWDNNVEFERSSDELVRNLRKLNEDIAE